ncbi:catalytic, putative [Ricinus communis]|uniref:Catalytic, putative n=3 Tax=Ricinus communis TaxID=3988 RepID=B9SPW6_RICCO|nr:catalytic, putative [Ricinus communis]
MSAISNFNSCSTRPETAAVNFFFDGKFNSGLLNWRRRATTRISIPFQSSSLRLGTGWSNSKDGSIRMALVDERIAPGRNVAERSGILAYDLVQGALVKWSFAMDKSMPDPPTAMLLHGILGSRKNWGTFTRRLAQEFPMWQFLLVDLRCHGDSASIKKRGPHTVASTALDVLKLVAQLRITPRILIGHSFGGKVVLSMVEQAAKPLARPVRAWVLDATPGKVRTGGDGEDHPEELISFLRKLPKEVSSKQEVVNALLQEGFSKDVAQWVVTNLQPNDLPGSSSGFSWVFDLEGISEMYQSYEETNLWKFVESLPRGVHVNFLKAERSLHRWALEDLQRIHAAEDLAAEEGGGVEMHVLEDAGHWVHADNPDGLFRILSSSFQALRT